MKMNKKGWLRILEAFIAIILIAGVLAFVYSRTIGKPTDRAEEIYKLQKTILDEIAADPQFRNASLQMDEVIISEFVGDRVPPGFNYTVRICDVADICGLPYYKKEVYSSERIISSTLEEYDPKKVKIFMWRE
jgi:hypothetical protein